MSEKCLQQYEEAVSLVDSFFNDSNKAKLWMETQNPLLGDMSPLGMILSFRGEKLIAWIKQQLDEDTIE